MEEVAAAQFRSHTIVSHVYPDHIDADEDSAGEPAGGYERVAHDHPSMRDERAPGRTVETTESVAADQVVITSCAPPKPHFWWQDKDLPSKDFSPKSAIFIGVGISVVMGIFGVLLPSLFAPVCAFAIGHAVIARLVLALWFKFGGFQDYYSEEQEDNDLFRRTRWRNLVPVAIAKSTTSSTPSRPKEGAPAPGVDVVVPMAEHFVLPKRVDQDTAAYVVEGIRCASGFFFFLIILPIRKRFACFLPPLSAAVVFAEVLTRAAVSAVVAASGNRSTRRRTGTTGGGATSPAERPPPSSDESVIPGSSWFDSSTPLLFTPYVHPPFWWNVLSTDVDFQEKSTSAAPSTKILPSQLEYAFGRDSGLSSSPSWSAVDHLDLPATLHFVLLQETCRTRVYTFLDTLSGLVQPVDVFDAKKIPIWGFWLLVFHVVFLVGIKLHWVELTK